MHEDIAAPGIGFLAAAMYEAALEPQRWPLWLAALHRHLDFANAALIVSAPYLDDGVLCVTAGMPARFGHALTDHVADLMALWRPAVRPATFSRLDQPPGVFTARFVREWAGPQALSDLAGVRIDPEATTAALLVLGRHRDAGPIGDPSLDALASLVPHLRRAIGLDHQRRREVADLNAMRALLDRLAAPVFVVDRTMRLLHANHAAQESTDQSVVTAAQGRVRFGRPQSDSLGKALDEATRPHGGRPHNALSVDVGSARIAVLHVISLPTADAAASAAVIVTGGSNHVRFAQAIAELMFHLTAAEAKVFGCIASGATIAETAERLRVRGSTVRTHLLRLFDKTGTRRQADLVGLAAQLICIPLTNPG